MQLKMSQKQIANLSSKVIGMKSQSKMPTNNNLNDSPPIPKKYKKREKQLTPEQIEVFKQAFQIFDHDHSGSIDQQELESLLAALGFNYTPAQVEKIFARGRLRRFRSDINERVREIHVQADSTHAITELDTESLKVQILKVFRHFDEDNSGYLDTAKIRNMLSECFFNLDDNAITNMIAAADTDGDGKISEYEFMRLMKKVKLV